MKLLNALLVLLALMGCSGTDPIMNTYKASAQINAAPLTEMGSSLYLGEFEGGLYPGGSNTAPAIHDSLGAVSRALIGPSHIFLSIGYSNAAQEWCSKVTLTSFPACNSWSFTGKARSDASVRNETQRIFDGAIGGQTNLAWDSPTDTAYGIVKSRLASKGLQESQVRVVWLKVGNLNPTTPLPAANADAYKLMSSTGDVIRALQVRYPNLKQVYVSPRIYGGYSSGPTNPEPFAYEGGFAVKRVVEAQINQYSSGQIDTLVGDLGPTVAPFVTWGPYMWANGTTPRVDGLRWLLSDFEADRIHPNTTGETKAANYMLNFFKTNPYSSCWFKNPGIC